MKLHFRTLAILTGAGFAVGCGETTTTPTESAVTTADVTASAGRHHDAGATTGWNEMATALADATPADAARLYTYLSLAQLRAAEQATGDRRHGKDRRYNGRRFRSNLSVSAAVGGASAAVLNAFFAGSVAQIEAVLDAQEAAAILAGQMGADFAEAEALGRAVAVEVLAYAAGDQWGATNPGTPPTGSGYWLWNGNPVVRGGYRARPFFLASDSQFRAAPPPMFGSTAYLVALSEVRQISDTRTADQLATAIFWNIQQSGRRNSVWNNKAVELIRAQGYGDAWAARILFLMNASVFDGSIGCFDSKYHYWFIRPPQADADITLPIGLPNHPSYPSAHSCVSGATSGVLMAFFPSHRNELEGLALESSLSRLYGGIHYRFDMEAGIALGQAVATEALRADLTEVAVVP